VIERAVILCDGRELEESLLPYDLQHIQPSKPNQSSRHLTSIRWKNCTSSACLTTPRQPRRTARLLNIGVATLYRKLKDTGWNNQKKVRDSAIPSPGREGRGFCDKPGAEKPFLQLHIQPHPSPRFKFTHKNSRFKIAIAGNRDITKRSYGTKKEYLLAFLPTRRPYRTLLYTRPKGRLVGRKNIHPEVRSVGTPGEKEGF